MIRMKTQAKRNVPAPPVPVLSSPAISYRVEASNVHTHLFEVTLTIPQPQTLQRVSLPVWIPGEGRAGAATVLLAWVFMRIIFS